MGNRGFSKKIIQWYEENKRRLPWRETTDPYKIWLSEIILQQTRVAQGLPYYERFVKTFPNVFSLANAPQQEVLRLWQGLGYYSRARNLHLCAKSVVEDFGGKFPSSFRELTKLKGVGPYTAAAIASIAFKEAIAVVDGNVFRVLSRIFGIDKDIASNEGKTFFFEKANELIPENQPDLFNQAVMEFGALHCLPQNPLCNTCVFAKACVANLHDLQSVLPIKSKKLKVRTRYFYYFVLRWGNKIVMKQRKGKDIWQGLYDFYLIETKRKYKAQELIKKDPLLTQATFVKENKIITHILSHQRLKITFTEVEISSSQKFKDMIKDKDCGLRAFSKREIVALPKPIVIDRYF
jgi:A/G-specific adenine glycosylase